MIDRVFLSFEGQEIPLSFDGSTYTATFTAPAVSSWSQSDHSYAGIVTATDTDGNRDAMTAALRVRETVPPSIGFTEPMENWFFPTLTVRMTFEIYDAESGIENVTVVLDGEEVTVNESNEKYVFTGAVEQGHHKLTVTATDHDGNAATATRHFAAAGLITDRTPLDVQEVKALCNRAMRGDLASWKRLKEENLRGAYNASDLNRVGFATECVGAVWAAIGYKAPPLIAKQDWIGGFEDFDTPSKEQLTAYFADSAAIHDLIPAHIVEAMNLQLPDAPDTRTTRTPSP